MVRSQAITYTFLASVLILSSCGDDYTKNQNPDSKPSSANNNTNNSQGSSADGTGKSDTGSSGDNQSGTTGNDTAANSNGNNDTTNGTTGTTSSGITIQDILAGIFGGVGSGNNTGTDDQPGATDQPQGGNTPVQPAPEPTADDCIGADEFICAVEVAITYHTNLLRAGSDLQHHARLSYVARDWSRQQMERGSIGHQGFPAARRTFYNASFPGDTVSIQAENVAYSSGRSGATAEDVAKMFVTMWKNSAGHRRNMLGNYQILGVGVTKSGSRYYATQIFGAE